ncbi:MAG: radical SAM family heme chaperone HemW [Candidatus Rokubacteria bacterium]|nr:radical SAM family heme chaperone HemW [Candidatus Rokubacteria bacterium]
MVAAGAADPLSGAAGPLAAATREGPAGTLGIYLHCLFCLRRCPYCDFNVALYREDRIAPFLDALHRELALYGREAWASRTAVESLFFGGGTPSLLEPAAIGGLIEAVARTFPVQPGAEITLEANPERLTRERLLGYRAAGVTRLSLGVQALDDRVLARLGRGHTAEEARRAFGAARAAGFAAVSVDLLYACPGQDLAGWGRGLAEVVGWTPEHLSCYALTLEPGTAFARRPLQDLPDEETQLAQYRAMVEGLGAAGYEQYEISNFARPGHRSVHNQRYWRGEEYLGLGPGAHSFLGAVRFANLRSQLRYRARLDAGLLPIESWERLSPAQRLGERIVFGLRLAEGIPRTWLAEGFAAAPATLERLLARYGEAGLLLAEGERVRLTEAGRLLADAIGADLLPAA